VYEPARLPVSPYYEDGEAEDRNRADQCGQTADDERPCVRQHVELEQHENCHHRDQRTRLIDRADSPEYEP